MPLDCQGIRATILLAECATPLGALSSRGIHLFGLARTRSPREKEREYAREERKSASVPFVLPGASSDWRVRSVAPAMAAFSRARDIGPIAYSRAFLGGHCYASRIRLFVVIIIIIIIAAGDVYLYELPAASAMLVRTTRFRGIASSFVRFAPDGPGCMVPLESLYTLGTLGSSTKSFGFTYIKKIKLCE